MMLGIDEAGRGSLIGPMIVAGVILDKEGEKRLSEVGVKDSKKLSPNKRNKLLDEIINEAHFIEVVPVGPQDIDTNNLNLLTRRVMNTIINDALSLFDLDIIIMDRVGRSYSLTKVIGGRRVRIVMEEKADAKYVVVSAASIVAKVFRDWIISYVCEMYGLGGSGYPSDTSTIEWVKNNVNRIPRWLIRYKWRTLKQLEEKSNVTIGSLDRFLRGDKDAH